MKCKYAIITNTDRWLNNYNTFVNLKNANKDVNILVTDHQKYIFTINETILQYLETVEVENGKLPLVIYVNYVKQYTFKFEYLCDKNEVSASVTDTEGKPLIEGKNI